MLRKTLPAPTQTCPYCSEGKETRSPRRPPKVTAEVAPCRKVAMARESLADHDKGSESEWGLTDPEHLVTPTGLCQVWGGRGHSRGVARALRTASRIETGGLTPGPCSPSFLCNLSKLKEVRDVSTIAMERGLALGASPEAACCCY